MGMLIEGLLSLSRISATEIQIEPIDISGLGTEILNRLAEAHPDRVVRTEVHPGIVVNGDAVLCEIALTNILENAWKFTAKGPDARIEIKPVESPDGRGFRVHDNGVGFAPSTETVCSFLSNGSIAPPNSQARASVWPRFIALPGATAVP